MTNNVNAEAIVADEIGALYAASPWQLALISHGGTILALSRPLLDLLNAPAATWLGKPFDTLVVEHERSQIRALFTQIGQGETIVAARAHLVQQGQFPLAVEFELLSIDSDVERRLIAVVYPVSIVHRRERIILEFNRLAPRMLEARSAPELYRIVAQALQPLGMGIMVTALEPDQMTQRIDYLGLSPSLSQMLQRLANTDFSQLRIPRTAPLFDRVFEQREAHFVEGFVPLLHALLPGRIAAVYQGILPWFGVRNYVLAPLLAGAHVRGALMIWSHVLDREQMPFIEAFAYQLGTALAQIELHVQMERQMQRLNSLAATAHAVTTLGSLDDVLKVVCTQAQQLFDADFARIAAPIEGTDELIYIMSTGAGDPHLRDIPIPIATSISGTVFQTGQGRMLADLQQTSEVYPPFRAMSPARSVIYQPLKHRGAVLGVLIVGHAEVGYFKAVDLDFAGRYAEYAAVAIANAQLHTALQRSEREQQRHRRELEALLSASEALNSSLDLDMLLQAGLRTIDELGLATFAAVIMPAEHSSDLIARAQRGVPPASSTVHRRLIGHPEVIEQIGAGNMLRVSEELLRQCAQATPAAEDLARVHMLFIPLLSGGAPLGALNVGRSGDPDYGERDIALLQAIAGQMAQAIAKALVYGTLRTTALDNARLYREAQAMHTYLNTLMRNTPALLLTVQPDMTVHVLNPDGLVDSSFSATRLEGRTIFELTPPQAHAELLERSRLVQSGIPQSFELDLSPRYGRPLHVLLSAALIPDYGELFVIIKDVTEQRQREAYLRQNEKLAALGGMVAGAAHELNNPLAAILGLAQLQLDEPMSDELRTDLYKIERAALRARSIVQRLLHFASPQPPHLQPVALRPLLRDTLERLEQLLDANDIRVSYEIAADLPPTSGDPHQLEQLLFNILHNAAQSLADAPADRPRRLHIAATIEQERIQLRIEDTGPGIPPEHLSRIFEPFFTTRAIGQGTGLGLAICHAIVQQHKGRIWAHSQPGQGATFFIELPLSRLVESLSAS
jgi:signal transduction histidine kinase